MKQGKVKMKKKLEGEENFETNKTLQIKTTILIIVVPVVVCACVHPSSFLSEVLPSILVIVPLLQMSLYTGPNVTHHEDNVFKCYLIDTTIASDKISPLRNAKNVLNDKAF